MVWRRITRRYKRWRTGSSPQDLTGLQALLGLVGYYRQYIPDFAGIVQPLNRLTAKRVPWQWTPVKQQAFDHFKSCLLEAPILAYPDLAEEYILDTNASDHNVDAVLSHLSQVQEGREVVVVYYSKSLSAAENTYCTTRKKFLAVIKAVKHFRPYRRFWPGKKHGNANGGCKQCLGIEKRDGGPSRSDLETLAGNEMEYNWDHGQLKPIAGEDTKAVQAFHTNPVLAGNVTELRKLQENFLGSVADVYRAKKKGWWPSEKQLRQECAEFLLFCQRWDSLRISDDGLLTITLAANGRHPERRRVVCPAAIRRELI